MRMMDALASIGSRVDPASCVCLYGGVLGGACWPPPFFCLGPVVVVVLGTLCWSLTFSVARVGSARAVRISLDRIGVAMHLTLFLRPPGRPRGALLAGAQWLLPLTLRVNLTRVHFW